MQFFKTENYINKLDISCTLQQLTILSYRPLKTNDEKIIGKEKLGLFFSKCLKLNVFWVLNTSLKSKQSVQILDNFDV